MSKVIAIEIAYNRLLVFPVDRIDLAMRVLSEGSFFEKEGYGSSETIKDVTGDMNITSLDLSKFFPSKEVLEERKQTEQYREWWSSEQKKSSNLAKKVAELETAFNTLKNSTVCYPVGDGSEHDIE